MTRLEKVATGVKVVTRAAGIDRKLGALVIPVSDVGRAKQFYANLGWRLDADFPFENGFRVVQFTPPGLYLIVTDIEAARGEFVARDVHISEVFHAGTPGAQFQPDGSSGRLSWPAPDHASYSSSGDVNMAPRSNDPDGNTWRLQEVTTRLPGRIDPGETSFAWATDLASALRRAEAALGEHEKRTGQRDENWPEWYAA